MFSTLLRLYIALTAKLLFSDDWLQINKALHPTAVRYEDSMCVNTFGSEHEAAQKDSETFTNTSSHV